MELMFHILDEMETIQIDIQQYPLLQDVYKSNVNFKFSRNSNGWYMFATVSHMMGFLPIYWRPEVIPAINLEWMAGSS